MSDTKSIQPLTEAFKPLAMDEKMNALENIVAYNSNEQAKAIRAQIEWMQAWDKNLREFIDGIQNERILRRHTDHLKATAIANIDEQALNDPARLLTTSQLKLIQGLQEDREKSKNELNKIRQAAITAIVVSLSVGIVGGVIGFIWFLIRLYLGL